MQQEISKNRTYSKKIELEVDSFVSLWKRRPFIAFIVGLLILVPYIVIGFNYLLSIPKLKEEVSKLESELNIVRDERDSTKEQLAPFLALASSSFPNTREGDRLVLLLDRLEAATISLEKSSQRSSGEYEVDGKRLNLLKETLKSVPPGEVEFGVQHGNVGAFNLSKRLADIFSTVGWKVTGPNAILSSSPLQGVTVQINPDTPKPRRQALLPLFDGLGIPRVAQPETSLESGKIKILIGSPVSK